MGGMVWVAMRSGGHYDISLCIVFGFVVTCLICLSRMRFIVSAFMLPFYLHGTVI